MNYKHEFGTVELLLKSEFETRGVDSFAISLIKVERQMRRIFTYLIYQNESFNGNGDVIELRNALADNGKMYFENFIVGIDKIYHKSVRDIYGENYDKDFSLLKEYIKDRNKIFHGQLTKNGLTRCDLIKRVETMKKWSKRISDKFSEEIGYDGFRRNSYHKSSSKLFLNDTDNFSSVDNFKAFLKTIDRSSKNKTNLR